VVRPATALGQGIAARLVSPNEIEAMVPYLDATQLIAGLFVPGDRTVAVKKVLRALQEGAACCGVRFVEETSGIDFEREGNRIVGVMTSNGPMQADQVVLAVGIWGRHLAQRLGLELPLFPVQHPYVYTEPLKMLSMMSSDPPRPMIRDLDNVLYLREHDDRLGYGWYSHEPSTFDPDHILRADVPFPDAGFGNGVNLDLFPCLKDVWPDKITGSLGDGTEAWSLAPYPAHGRG
jgi:glycine/D-amino acid oxidase-like deaminating enzyme